MLGMEVSRATIDGAIAKPGMSSYWTCAIWPGCRRCLSLIKRHHPQTAIVVVSSTLDSALLLDAMRAGVNEVLPEPVTHGRSAKASSIGSPASAPNQNQGTCTGSSAPRVASGRRRSRSTWRPSSVLQQARSCTAHRLAPCRGDAAMFTGVEPRFSVVDALENTHRLDQNLFRNLVIEDAPHTDLLASPERPLRPSSDADRIERLIAFASGYLQAYGD